MNDPELKNGPGLSKGLRAKLDALQGLLLASRPSLLAVSGGIDSRVLAACVRLWTPESKAVVFTGAQFAPSETDYAAEYLRWLGLGFELQEVQTLRLPEVSRNTRQRCYACKKTLFSGAQELASRDGFFGVLEGSQQSDAGYFRPGSHALHELGVRSPLKEVGLTKDEVRALAAHFGLPWPDQPSRPCLLTRLAYGARVDRETLQRVARVEESISRLGLREFRLRVPRPGSCLLQIFEGERAEAEDLQDRLHRILAHSGFADWSVRIEGTLSGFFD